MPQIFKFGPYYVYFWSNENDPLEPVHVHVCEGRPVANATKLWITETGKCDQQKLILLPRSYHWIVW